MLSSEILSRWSHVQKQWASFSPHCSISPQCQQCHPPYGFLKRSAMYSLYGIYLLISCLAKYLLSRLPMHTHGCVFKALLSLLTSPFVPRNAYFVSRNISFIPQIMGFGVDNSKPVWQGAHPARIMVVCRALRLTRPLKKRCGAEDPAPENFCLFLILILLF